MVNFLMADAPPGLGDEKGDEKVERRRWARTG
jgi:hypothetical protein